MAFARCLRCVCFRLSLCVLCFSTRTKSMPCDFEHFNFQILHENFDTRNPCATKNTNGQFSNYPGYGEDDDVDVDVDDDVDPFSTFHDDVFKQIPFRFPTSAEFNEMFKNSDEQYNDLSWDETSKPPRSKPLPDFQSNFDVNQQTKTKEHHYFRTDSKLEKTTKTSSFHSNSEINNISPVVKSSVVPANINCEDTSSLEIPPLATLNDFIDNAFQTFRESPEQPTKTHKTVTTNTNRPKSDDVDKEQISGPQNKFQRRYYQDFKEMSPASSDHNLKQELSTSTSVDVGKTTTSIRDEPLEDSSHKTVVEIADESFERKGDDVQEEYSSLDPGTTFQSQPSELIVFVADSFPTVSATETIDQDLSIDIGNIVVVDSTDYVITQVNHFLDNGPKISTSTVSHEHELLESSTNLWLGEMPVNRQNIDSLEIPILSASVSSFPEVIPVPPVALLRLPSALSSLKDIPDPPLASILSFSDSLSPDDIPVSPATFIRSPSALSEDTPVSPVKSMLSPSALSSTEDTPVSQSSSILPVITSSSSSSSSSSPVPPIVSESSEMVQNDMFGVMPCVQGFSRDHKGKCRLIIQPITRPHYSHTSVGAYTRRPRQRRVHFTQPPPERRPWLERRRPTTDVTARLMARPYLLNIPT